MTPHYILEALTLYSQTEPCIENPKLIGNLKTTLKRYVLEGLPKGTLSKQDLSKKLEYCLGKVEVSSFIKADPQEIFLEHAQAAVDAGKITQRTVDNYRSALLRFISWMRSQQWYEEVAGSYSGTHTPTLRYRGVNLVESRKGKRAYVTTPYGIKQAELSPHLAEQLEKLEKFCTARKVAKRQDAPIRQETFKSNKRHILAFLGWLKNIEGWSVDELDLRLLTDRDTLDEFVSWAISERDNSYNWARLVSCSSLLIAKWLHYRSSKKAMYRDIDEIEAIRAYIRELSLAQKAEPSRQCIEEKSLTFEQCQEIVRYLRKCCAPRNSRHAKRTDLAILKSRQKYLLIALLTYCPVRQREIRELEIGRTLFREENGYVVRLEPEDHKTGSKTGKGREYKIPPQLTDDLDEWLDIWRPKISKDHNFVFIKVGGNIDPDGIGQPLSPRGLHSMVTTTIYHVTAGLFGEGKRTNPHFFRNIAITYQRSLPNQSLEEREGLAEIMGHSVAMADKTYSLMTSQEKTAKAVEWWKPKSVI